MVVAPRQDTDLVEHLARTTGLSKSEARRLVGEVLAYFAETTDELVRRRHAELQGKGLTNDQIFPQLASELSCRLVAPAALSLRQLRRIVYG